jgi:hypothetical protein
MKVYETDKDLTADHAMNCGFHILFAHLSALNVSKRPEGFCGASAAEYGQPQPRLTPSLIALLKEVVTRDALCVNTKLCLWCH